jgi:outer membrane protein OmpA-like peptidoglycan-associated protein
MAMAARSSRDSVYLAEARENLKNERSKRSEAEKQLLSTGLLMLDAVYFQTNGSEISLNSKPYLNVIAKMLTKHPKLRIEVGGHTDNMGTDAYNMSLGQIRARTVMDYLTDKSPELRGGLSAKGFGESQPKSDNGTADGRKRNRRTELQVLNRDILTEYKL